MNLLESRVLLLQKNKKLESIEFVQQRSTDINTKAQKSAMLKELKSITLLVKQCKHTLKNIIQKRTFPT